MKPVKNSHYSDLIRRLLFLLGALIVYRFGSHIPVPGVDLDAFTQLFKSQQGGILGVLNVFSGGALGRSSIFALNVMPYISASIIMQLLTVVLPSLEAMKKEGPSGQRRITRITRYATLGLALFQSYAVSAALQSNRELVPNPGLIFNITTVVSLTTGTMFLMWLGEQITERGIGNGISLIIFAGIAAGLPSAIGGIFNLVSTGAMHPLVAILVCILALAVTAIVVFVEKGLRKIPINHPGRQMVGARSSGVAGVLPLKLNMPGVIPPIFASSLILFPATIAGFSSSGNSDTFGGRVMEMVKDVASALTPGQPLYLLGYATLIIFFCFFYTALVFNSKQVADDLKRGGGLVPGIRPGDQTARYIDRVLMRLTFSGALYVTAICLLPEFLRVWFNVPFYFGGTSLLIVVVVAMDFMQQTQAYLMSHHYEGLLKKTNFKTR